MSLSGRLRKAVTRRRLIAGSVVLVLPVLIIFILFQRWITEGIATTGLKG